MSPGPTPPVVPRIRSLRLKLLLVSVAIEMVMLTLLVANGARLIHNHLADNTASRLRAQDASFNIALSGLLAARDYASLQSVLEGWGGIPGITYMVVTDSQERRVAATAWTEAAAPPQDEQLSYDSPVYHAAFDVTLLGERYGRAYYGLDTSNLARARRELIQQSVVIALAEVVLTLALLAVIGYWLTRHLDLLARASLKMARGDFSLRLKIPGRDEIGVLTGAFNTMSAAVESRIAALEDGERRFRAIADYTHAWESWFGPDGRLHWVNPAVERITGQTPPDCYAMADFPLPVVAADDRAAVTAMLDSAKAGGSGQDMEFRIKRRQGDTLWVAMSWQPICDRAGISLGWRSSIRDISMQKRSADLLVEAKADLERMLFAASHDLQEPVRTVLSYSQRLERECGGGLPADAIGTLATIQEASRQLALLVKGLANYSRSDRTMAAFTRVDCRHVVDQVVEDCRAVAGASGSSFRVGDLPVVQADYTLLAMLFENLIGNALKYARPNVPPVVTITASPEGEGWRMDIADNGIGIEADYLHTITRPFSRLHSRALFPGAGLGLASALKVATIHGGRLWLDSVPGQGTIVHLWLPAGDAAANSPRPYSARLAEA